MENCFIAMLPLLGISLNISAGKVFTIVAGAIAAYFAPVSTLIWVMVEFIGMDFIVGVWASRCRAKRRGDLDKWFFSSHKMWRTVYKLGFSIISVVLAYHLDNLVLTFADLRLAGIVCGIVCGSELWSFLEASACISDHPIFRWLQKVAGGKLKEHGVDVEEFKMSEKDLDKEGGAGSAK